MRGSSKSTMTVIGHTMAATVREPTATRRQSVRRRKRISLLTPYAYTARRRYALNMQSAKSLGWNCLIEVVLSIVHAKDPY